MIENNTAFRRIMCLVNIKKIINNIRRGRSHGQSSFLNTVISYIYHFFSYPMKTKPNDIRNIIGWVGLIDFYSLRILKTNRQVVIKVYIRRGSGEAKSQWNSNVGIS